MIIRTVLILLLLVAGVCPIFADPHGALSSASSVQRIHFGAFTGTNLTLEDDRTLALDSNDSILCSGASANCSRAVYGIKPGSTILDLSCYIGDVSGTHTGTDGIEVCVLAHEVGEYSTPASARSLGCLELGKTTLLTNGDDMSAKTITLNATLTSTEVGISAYTDNGVDAGGDAGIAANCYSTIQ